MKFRLISSPRVRALSCSIALVIAAVVAPALLAQTSIEVFSPVNVRLSPTGTGYGSAAINFNSSTLSLNCAASPIVASLSSTPDNTGNLLVDNNINVTVTAGTTTTGPTNVCVGGVNGSPIGPFQNCFNSKYEDVASAGTLTGTNPDDFTAQGGVAPIDISGLLSSGNLQVKIDMQDEGFFLTNSTIYLNTNCTQLGVTGPALASGNPIPSSNPTPDQLSQDFSFNPTTNQQIGFEYDLTTAQTAGGLTITDGTIPQVADLPVDPATFQSVFVPQTPFATSNCLVHSGETLANGQPACKIYTLTCAVGTGADATGAQCPVSTLPNEIFQDVFSGPAFTLSDISTPNGTFHQGIGFLMASEGWQGGPCTFDPAANLGDLACPQNLLTSFNSSSVAAQAKTAGKIVASPNSAAVKTKALAVRAQATTAGSGSTTYTGTGRTTHPNSEFITIAGVPEPLTTVTLPGSKGASYSPPSGGQFPMNWFNTDPTVAFSVQPPNLAGSNIPGAAVFVPSPILNLTYGTSASGFPPSDFPPPAPGEPIQGDTTLTDSNGCPAPNSPLSTAAFNSGKQTLTGLAEGTYLLHYFAQDCAGTQELLFTQDNTGNWSTNFFTVPFGVDRTPPTITAQFPPVNANAQYQKGQVVPLQFSCSDALSGIANCDNGGNGAGSTPGSYFVNLDTSSVGAKTVKLTASDNAGNTASVSFQYTVVPPPPTSSVQLTLVPSTVTYPAGGIAIVKVQGPAGSTKAPTGTVQLLLDGSKSLGSDKLVASGKMASATIAFLSGINVGHHTVTAVYAGDSNNPGGSSTAVSLTVNPSPVVLQVNCPKTTITAGSGFSCQVIPLSLTIVATGSITYSLDNGAPVTVAISKGVASFTVTTPVMGKHSVVISYAAQGNYAAATPKTVTFTVQAAKNSVIALPRSAQGMVRR